MSATAVTCWRKRKLVIADMDDHILHYHPPVSRIRSEKLTL
jgi:hypothetical protein